MPEKEKISPAEARRRTYGAQQDADTERLQEEKDREPDTRADWYGEDYEEKHEDDPQKAVEDEQKELKGMRPDGS